MLAVITARAGSKGLPGKNIRPLGGKPLIAYTIEAAIKSGVFKRVIVSTEDEKIAEVATAYKAEAPFLRPRELAADETKGIDVIMHSLKWLEKNQGYYPTNVALLQPTSPFRNYRDIINAYSLFKEKNAARLVSLKESKEHYHWMFSLDDGLLNPVVGDFSFPTRRQDLPEVYTLNGAICMARRDVLLREKSFLGPDTVGFIMPRINSIDIDDIIDFRMAEKILEKEALEA